MKISKEKKYKSMVKTQKYGQVLANIKLRLF